MTKCLFNGLTEKVIYLLALQEDSVCQKRLCTIVSLLR